MSRPSRCQNRTFQSPGPWLNACQVMSPMCCGARAPSRRQTSCTPASGGRRSQSGRVPVLAWIRAADERVALDENRLAAAEAERVRVADGLVAELLQLRVTFPEALLEIHRVTFEPEAR